MILKERSAIAPRLCKDLTYLSRMTFNRTHAEDLSKGLINLRPSHVSAHFIL